jgi:hypothetical protein
LILRWVMHALHRRSRLTLVIYRVPLATDSEQCPYQPSGEYRMPLPGLHGKQRLRVLDARRERLALVTWAEVRQEVGTYRTRGAWQQAWVKRHDKAWCLKHPQASDDDLERRFRVHWAKQDCWVLSFVLLEAHERFLADQRRRTQGEGQYTANVAMAIDTLPVMDPSPEHVKQAREDGAFIRAQRLRTRQLEIAAARKAFNAERGKLRAQRFAG